MAKYTRKDIEHIYNVKPATLRKWISRKKFIVGEDGHIDSNNVQNNRFLNYIEKTYKNVEVSAKKEPKKEPDDTAHIAAVPKKLTDSEKQSLALFDSYEIQKKKVDIELKQRQIELKELEIEKKAGRLLPIDLIEKILTINNRSIFVNMEHFSRNQAAMMATDREELAVLEKELQKNLKTTVDKAKLDMQADLESAINEFMETRRPGEKK